MREWYENTNGNHVSEDEYGCKTTVCCCKDGLWRGICNERITADSFDSPEEAMNSIDNNWSEFVPIRAKPTDTTWKPAKKGGYYRTRNGTLICVKQASSGKWFVMYGDVVKQGQWFDTAQEARDYLDGL